MAKGFLMIGAMAALWLSTPLFLPPPPKLPIASANGIYVNACCEPIRLADGKLFVGGKSSAHYVIEQGKESPYLSPSSRVRVRDGAIEVDHHAIPETLTLWSGDLQLWDSDGEVYTFKRASAR